MAVTSGSSKRFREHLILFNFSATMIQEEDSDVNTDPEVSANAIIELAVMASSGHEAWTTFNHEFNRLYPGSITNIAVFNRKTLVPILVATSDLDAALEKDYVQHYGAINPWNEFWPKATTGKPYASARVQPSSLFERSEFYNDWLMKTGTIDCVGMKLVTSDQEIISFSTMLPRTGLEKNEIHALQLFERIGPSLTKGVEISRLHAKEREQNLGAAAVVDRSPDIAVVIDHALSLVAANEDAEHALRREGLILCQFGKFGFRHGGAAAWLRSAATDLLLDRPLSESRRFFRMNGRYVEITLSRLPSSGRSAIPSRMLQPFLLLIVVRELSAAAPSVSTKVLTDLFQLTEAEAAVCAQLRNGLTVSEIADSRQLSRETVRHHLKAIFRKSGTGRQAELVSLLQRLR